MRPVPAARFPVTHADATITPWLGREYDWTMRHRRGDFCIFQQHDDLLSPTYIADLVEASAQWPESVICFSKMQFRGRERRIPSLLGVLKQRGLQYLDRLDFEPFRGLIRGAALDQTSGLLLSDFDPFDSLGTEFRFMSELAGLGEFRFVEGPTYFKSWHGKNLSSKRKQWSMQHRTTATACWIAWMIEVIVPIGSSVQERRDMFKITLERFAGKHDPYEGIRTTFREVLRKGSKTFSLPRLRDYLKRSETPAARRLESILQGRIPPRQRPELLRQSLEMLKRGGRFDPREYMHLSWEALEAETFRHYRMRPVRPLGL